MIGMGNNLDAPKAKKTFTGGKVFPPVKESDSCENNSLELVSEADGKIVKPTLKEISEEIKAKYPDLSVEYIVENEEITIKEA